MTQFVDVDGVRLHVRLDGPEDAPPLVLALAVFGGLLFTQRRNLEALRLGDDTAAALGVPLARSRIAIVVAAVGMIATATAVTGPIAFISFLSGPIASRLIGSGTSLLLPGRSATLLEIE